MDSNFVSSTVLVDPIRYSSETASLRWLLICLSLVDSLRFLNKQDTWKQIFLRLFYEQGYFLTLLVLFATPNYKKKQNI